MLENRSSSLFAKKLISLIAVWGPGENGRVLIPCQQNLLGWRACLTDLTLTLIIQLPWNALNAPLEVTRVPLLAHRRRQLWFRKHLPGATEAEEQLAPRGPFLYKRGERVFKEAIRIQELPCEGSLYVPFATSQVRKMAGTIQKM